MCLVNFHLCALELGPIDDLWNLNLALRISIPSLYYVIPNKTVIHLLKYIKLFIYLVVGG